jgi:hypothetical protein
MLIELKCPSIYLFYKQTKPHPRKATKLYKIEQRSSTCFMIDMKRAVFWLKS